jgi:hypothetical protein
MSTALPAAGGSQQQEAALAAVPQVVQKAHLSFSQSTVTTAGSGSCVVMAAQLSALLLQQVETYKHQFAPLQTPLRTGLLTVFAALLLLYLLSRAALVPCQTACSSTAC